MQSHTGGSKLWLGCIGLGGGGACQTPWGLRLAGHDRDLRGRLELLALRISSVGPVVGMYRGAASQVRKVGQLFRASSRAKERPILCCLHVLMPLLIAFLGPSLQRGASSAVFFCRAPTKLAQHEPAHPMYLSMPGVAPLKRLRSPKAVFFGSA